MNISELYQLYLQSGQQLTTDSRHCPKGSLFLALKGASFNGNKFAAAALDSGSAYAIIDEPEYLVPGDSRYILVPDALLCYKELARHHRRRFHFPVIGITGTNGKTTSKELVAAVLSQKYKVLYTEGNFNNDVGVPKTLLRFAAEHEIAVVEMGASHVGDIEKLVRYVEPTAGLITNVGRAHLEGFGSFEGIMRAKGELYDFLSNHQGLLFLNSGDAHLTHMAQQRNFDRIYTYADADTHSPAMLIGKLTGCSPFLSLDWHTVQHGMQTAAHRVQTQLIGAYNMGNVLAAIAIGLEYGVPPQDICRALEQYTPHNNRSQFMRTAHNALVVDAYNANPTSMKAALENFQLMQAPQKMLILGDMLELGQDSACEHREVLRQVEQMGFDRVWLVGGEWKEIDTPYQKFANVEEVKLQIEQQPIRNCTILVKGSHGSGVWQLPPLL